MKSVCPALIGVVLWLSFAFFGYAADDTRTAPGAASTVAVDHNIVLLVDGVTDRQIIDGLTKRLTEKLGLPIVEKPNPFDFSPAYIASRQQYRYDRMIALVRPQVKGTLGRVVILTAKDTFGEGLNWSTGVSYVSGTVALVSVCRLNPKFWGAAEDEDLYIRRVNKIALHELGHTFGKQSHCENWACCIHGSNSIEEIDKTGDDYCADCQLLVDAALAKIKGSEENRSENGK